MAICGSPAAREVQLAAQIETAMQQQALNLVGQTSLKQLAAVLQQAVLVLAPDSGPAHIATTQGHAGAGACTRTVIRSAPGRITTVPMW